MLTLSSNALGNMIQFITEMVGWSFDVRASGVVVQKNGGAGWGRVSRGGSWNDSESGRTRYNIKIEFFGP